MLTTKYALNETLKVRVDVLLYAFIIFGSQSDVFILFLFSYFS